MKSHSSLSPYQITLVALMSALLCILAPISIPIGAVPISLTSFVLYLTLYLVGTKLCFISYLIYLFLGFAGIPVFSGYSGGLNKLAGPTGGYLVGFLFLIICTGSLLHNNYRKTAKAVLAMISGTLITYLFGTIWFVLQMHCSIAYAFSICVLPFLLGDGIKIILAAKIGPQIRAALSKSNLLKSL